MPVVQVGDNVEITPKEIERRKKISRALMGHPMSERARKIIGDIHRGKCFRKNFLVTYETRQKLSAASKILNLGRKHSEETKQKIGKAHLGQKHPNSGLKRAQMYVAGWSPSPFIKEILDGELLGDGSIIMRTYTAHFLHTTISEEYEKWLGGLFENEGIKIKYSSYQPKLMGRKRVFSIRTESSFELCNERKRWYPDGKKRVPRDIQLTSTVCLHWFLGDGCYGKHSGFIKLCTAGFPHNDVGFLCDELNKVMNISAHYLVDKNGYATIYINGVKNMKNFLSYIGQCPVNFFNYKWALLAA